MCGILVFPFANFDVGYVKDSLIKMSSRGFDSLGIAAFNGPSSKIIKCIPSGDKFKFMYGDRPEQEASIEEILNAASNSAKDGWCFLHTRWATSGVVDYTCTHPITSYNREVCIIHNGIIDYDNTKYKHDTQFLADLIQNDELSIRQAKGDFACVWYNTVSQEVFAYRTGDTPLLISDDNYIASNANYFPQKSNWKELPANQIIKIEYKTREQSHSRLNLAKKHFMLQEIESQLEVAERATFRPLAIDSNRDWSLIACGSSYHAAMYASKIYIRPKFHPERPLDKSDNRYRIYISQSGETAEILKSVDEIETNYAITNNSSSSLARKVGDTNTICLSGKPEFAVAATRTFFETCFLFKNGYFKTDNHAMIEFLSDLQERITELRLHMNHMNYDRYYILSTGALYPIALEGALKLKEVARVQAEGVYSPEIKHGPIAILNEDTLCIFLISNSLKMEQINEIKKNIDQVRSHKGKTFVIGDADVLATVNGDYKFQVKHLPHELLFGYVVPLQYLSYFLALKQGYNPDRVENLAKEITV